MVLMMKTVKFLRKWSVEGGDGDNEEGYLRCAEYEAILKEHDSQDDKFDPDKHERHLDTETIKAPEILFQPSIVGMGNDQAGLSHLIEFVLSKYPADVSDRNSSQRDFLDLFWMKVWWH